MARYSRRRFLQWTAGASGAALLMGCAGFDKHGKTLAKVIVVGGGFAGATAAKYLRLLDDSIQVTLIEPKKQYISCPGSNWLFAGLTGIADLTVDYRALSSQYGIAVITDSVARIETGQREVILQNLQTLKYDKLILAPGIDFCWDTLPGYSHEKAELFPHAWLAGPQTLLLQRQIEAIKDGDVVIISVPAEPYRCPPGPYERASMIAYWLQRHKPNSKLIILDAKSAFSKQKLFEAGWRAYFGYGTAKSIIEWHALADNPLQSLESKTRTLETYFGDKFQARVLNIIPPQQAAAIARQSGLSDVSGWCPVEASTGQSKFQEHVHIIGDAANYAPIPKSAFAANAEAKICAAAIVRILNELPVPDPQWLNTCYSLITPEHGISVAGVYKLGATKNIEALPGTGGLSSMDDPETAKLEAGYAQSIYRSLLKDSFA